MWRWVLGNLGYPAFGNDMMVKDRIRTALNMRCGDGGHWKASEGAAAESNS
jgi:hypothetical protein